MSVISQVNPTEILNRAGEFGWPVFVLVLIVLLWAGREYLVYTKVTAPESDARREMMAKLGVGSEKTGDAMDAMATTHGQYIAGLQELKKSHSEMSAELQSQGMVGRKLLRCTRVLCEMHEKHDTDNAKAYAQRMLDILHEN
jgi:hypothetical protein